jgi:hypothetical protein
MAAAVTVLEQVATDVSGHTLEQVHNKLAAAQAEHATLRAVPTPAADIEARIRAYVEAMARPTITGVGKGEKLKVVWPGAGWDIKGPIEHRAEVLPMMAMLFPDEMIAALTREVERIANDPLPVKQRAARIAELRREIDELGYVEEALVVANGAERSFDASPEAILGVRLAKKEKAAA